MSLIRSLPDPVIQQIAAGEVIDSMAAVVRELIENSLDAQATRLVIEVDPQNWCVLVTDNGIGMNCEDLGAAALPHTTSKIRSLDDLYQVQGLGFRGEALHSLAVLAELEISSSFQAAQGWQVKYDHEGRAAQVSPVAIAPGSRVKVSHLFAQWPSRQACFPSLAQQFKAIQATIYDAALTHPWVTWQVKRQGKAWFSLWPGQTVTDILLQILSSLSRQDLKQISVPLVSPGANTQTPIGSLEVVIGSPDRYHRRRPDWIKIALNQRLVKVPELEQTILRAFARTLPRHRFPLCWSHFVIPNDWVDWNRHPAKSEVYLQHLEYWQNYLADTLHKLFQTTLPRTLTTISDQQLQKFFNVAEITGTYRSIAPINPLFTSSNTPGMGIQSEVEANAEKPDPSITRHPPSYLQHTPIRAIAQLHQTYIVTEHPQGLWLVEQHIAHERVLYEQLCESWSLVPLASPLILNQLTPSQQSQLTRLGILFEEFGDQSWVVRSAPEIIAQRSDCAAALWEISLGGDVNSAQVAMACRGAIRNGTRLNLSEMQILLNQWQQTTHPHTCPHGRPICLALYESDLSRYFRRHWVIGKSHGI